MRDDRRPGRVEDYTVAFLTMIYPLILMALVTLWEFWGFASALVVSLIMIRAVRGLAVRRAAKDAAWDARVEAILTRHR